MSDGYTDGRIGKLEMELASLIKRVKELEDWKKKTEPSATPKGKPSISVVQATHGRR